ncbi:MAG: tRNA (adenosine(37)-N6)-threonylcarbamoyltransferase complex ATPase subunit type 1 TsaE [Chitinophagaceae bacterium]|nr:tRNA (adenosine(37)-N6)-threonylcarbamoyltransferase complex ATPase subunit type 1 TsaE [Chitinophagaceae bacterium]
MQIKTTLDKIGEAAHIFWQNIDGKIFAVEGDMGAGKTTFITALCHAKGVKSPVSSPTFSLINEYSYIENGVTHPIYHIDLYRVKDEQEAINAGIEDCLYSGNICFVEWPQKAPHLLPENTVHIYIEASGENTRLLKIDFHR